MSAPASRTLAVTAFVGALWALGLAACGSAAGGDEGGTGAAGAGGDGAGGGGATSGGVTIPDPPAPPASVTGLFGVSKLAGPTSKGEVQVNGWFQKPAKALNTPDVVAKLKGNPEIPLDTCSKPLPKFSISDGSQPMTLDAGMLKVKDPSGAAHPIAKSGFGTFIIYQGSFGADAFVPGGKYAFSATGGSIPGPSGEFHLPGDLTLTSPSTSKPLTVAKQPLSLTWTSVPDGRPVMITLHQKSTDVVCRANDDGEFTIPAEVFGYFGSTTQEPGSTDEDTLTVSHSVFYLVGADENLTILFADVGAKIPLQFP